MADQKLLSEYPLKRIQPIDGMPVTAEVWAEAHDYHRLRQRYHDMLQHRAGILTGLEVIASDPPDSSVYILPGAAVDPTGEIIVVSEPLAFDFGAAQGRLVLSLSYRESRPQQEPDSGRFYVHAQFGAEAGPSVEPGSSVELARVWRTHSRAIANAGQFDSPAADEIDLRYRLPAGSTTSVEPPESVAVCYVGERSEDGKAHGAANLARALNRERRQVCVDEDISLDSGLERYTLVYLVGKGSFQLGREEMNAIYAYLQSGGTILMENCHRDRPVGEQPGDAIFRDMFNSFGFRIANIPFEHALLGEPNLFAAPPAGHEEKGEVFLVGEGVVFSTCDYGCLWQGLRSDGQPSREDIRAALEWGENLLVYARKRHKEATGK